MGRRILRRHICCYSVCICPIKRTPGIYELNLLRAQCPSIQAIKTYLPGVALIASITDRSNVALLLWFSMLLVNGVKFAVPSILFYVQIFLGSVKCPPPCKELFTGFTVYNPLTVTKWYFCYGSLRCLLFVSDSLLFPPCMFADIIKFS